MRKAHRNRPLTEAQTKRNRYLSKTRYVVEQSFGTLHRKFRYARAAYFGLLKRNFAKVSVYTSVQSELQSALAGRSCSYLINSVCDPYLKNCRLVELFPEIEKQKWQLYLYRPYQTIVAERVVWVYNKLKEILLSKMV